MGAQVSTHASHTHAFTHAPSHLWLHSGAFAAFKGGGADWAGGRNHSTTIHSSGPSWARLDRRVDDDRYQIRCDWQTSSAGAVAHGANSSGEAGGEASGEASGEAGGTGTTTGGTADSSQGELAILQRAGPHAFLLRPPPNASTLDLTCLFAPQDGKYPTSTSAAWQARKGRAAAAALAKGVPTAAEVTIRAASAWAAYWQSGAFVELVGGDAGGGEAEGGGRSPPGGKLSTGRNPGSMDVGMAGGMDVGGDRSSSRRDDGNGGGDVGGGDVGGGDVGGGDVGGRRRADGADPRAFELERRVTYACTHITHST